MTCYSYYYSYACCEARPAMKTIHLLLANCNSLCSTICRKEISPKGQNNYLIDKVLLRDNTK